MTRRLALFAAAAAALVLPAGCHRNPPAKPLGSVYLRIARPEVWQVMPHSQADSLGIEPGDVIITYNGEPVTTNEDLAQAQERASQSAGIPVTFLRDNKETTVRARLGPLGIVPDAARYTSSLAIALEDVLDHYGAQGDYDWLAAALGVSFAFSARDDGCRHCAPTAITADNISELKRDFGLALRPVFVPGPVDSGVPDTVVARRAATAVRTELARGRTVLVLGVWSDETDEQWGIATRFDRDDTLVYGYSPGSAQELPLVDGIRLAYAVSYRPVPDPDAAQLLTSALVNALQLDQQVSDSGCQTGIAAYDVVFKALDTIPFCPVCGSQSQSCFTGLLLSLQGGKESADRFLRDMKEALPDQADLIDEVLSGNEAIESKVQGVLQSGVRLGTRESQQKLQHKVNDMQLGEADLLGVYEELIGAL